MSKPYRDVGSIPITRSTFISAHKNSIIMDLDPPKMAKVLTKVLTRSPVSEMFRGVIDVHFLNGNATNPRKMISLQEAKQAGLIIIR